MTFGYFTLAGPAQSGSAQKIVVQLQHSVFAYERILICSALTTLFPQQHFDRKTLGFRSCKTYHVQNIFKQRREHRQYRQIAHLGTARSIQATHLRRPVPHKARSLMFAQNHNAVKFCAVWKHDNAQCSVGLDSVHLQEDLRVDDAHGRTRVTGKGTLGH